jgi:asparagine synthase (glutamine-hydrolysing)
MFTADEIRLLLNGRLEHDPDPVIGSLRQRQETSLQDANAESAIDRTVVLELSSYMENTLLRDADALSMAHSLELRVPFLDRRLVDLVFSLPPELRRPGRSLGKRLLRRAFADVLPESVKNRRKRGFSLPLPIWMKNGDLREVVADCLSAESVGRRGLLDPSAVSAHLGAFYRRPSGVGNQGHLWMRIWMLTVLELWCRTHLDAASSGAKLRRPAWSGSR